MKNAAFQASNGRSLALAFALFCLVGGHADAQSGGAVVPGGGGVPSIAGTTNQINQSGSPGATTLSLSSTIVVPGTLTIPSGGLVLNGSGSGSSIINAPATGGGTATLPAGSGTLAFSSSIPSLPLSPANGGSGVANTGNLTWNIDQTFSFTTGQTMTFPAASTTLAGLGTAQTFSAANIFSAAGAASTPGLKVSGAHFSGGNGTTTQPQLLVQDSTATASTSWSTSGTAIGINAHSGIGNLFDFQLDGVSKVFSDAFGNFHAVSSITSGNAALNTNGITGQFNLPIGFVSSTNLAVSQDTSISRRAAANLMLGYLDVAAPIAQTLSVQSVIAGTSNAAGALWKLSDSIGTGTGASGGFEFDTHPAGSTGTAQNTSAFAAFKIDKTGVPVRPVFTVSTLPASPPTGSFAYVTDATVCTFQTTLTAGGSGFCPVVYNGSAWLPG